MSDPRRLSEREDFGGDLLRSAREDAPGRMARRRTAIALGLAVGAAAGGATTTVTAAAAPATKLASIGGIAALTKWIGIGVVGGVVAFGTVKYVAPTLREPAVRTTVVASPGGTLRARERARSTSPIASSPGASPLDPVPSASPGSPAPAASPIDSALAASPIAPQPIAPTPDAPTIAPSRSQSAAPPSVRPVADRSGSLADEIRALDHAGAALAAGDARGAIDAIDAHDRDFKDGALSQEADVIRIEALVANGDDAAAAARARAFLTTFPDGAQANHVRSVLGAIESDKKP